MGCFLGCFGGAKDKRRRKQRTKRVIPKEQRNVCQDPQQSVPFAEQSRVETPPVNSVPEFRDKPVEEEKLQNTSPSPSPCRSLSTRKRVTFDSNVTTYEPVSLYWSTDSLTGCGKDVEEEKEGVLKRPSPSGSLSEDDGSVASSVGSYPPNHRYHNSRESDDEVEEYGDSDLDEFEDLDDDDEDDYDAYDEENVDDRIASHKVWSESVLTESMESRTGNGLTRTMSEEVESSWVKSKLPKQEESKAMGSKMSPRDRSVYVNSVLNPVENITQWKAVKSKVTTPPLKPQKENAISDVEAPRISFSTEPIIKQPSSSGKQKSNPSKLTQEVAVDASLSNWLVSPETPTVKKTNFSGLETVASGKTMSQGSTSVRSFEDRPILGALTVEELKQMSSSSSPRKSPSRSPDEMPIIGTVGTYWNHSDSAKYSESASSFKGIPNTTSKYREDSRVNYYTTPFETRLERALKQGAAEA